MSSDDGASTGGRAPDAGGNARGHAREMTEGKLGVGREGTRPHRYAGWLLIASLVASCGSVARRPRDGGAGDGPSADRAGSGGSSPDAAGSGGSAGGTGGQTGGSGGGVGGTGGQTGGSGGGGVGGTPSASGGAAGLGGAANTGGRPGTGGASTGGAASGGAGPGTGGRGTGGSATGGAATGGRGTGGAATGGMGTGGAATGGAGGTGCPTAPSGPVCGCGARLDCNGVCVAAGTCSALAFDATTGSVTVAATTAMVMNQSATIEAWVQLNHHVEHAPIFRKVRGNEEDKTLSIEDGYVRVLFFRGSADYIDLTSKTRVPLGAWTHIAGVYDGSSIRIYVNGVRTDTAAVDGVKVISNSDGEVFIGRVATMYEVTFDGVISDVRVSSIARYGTTTFTPPALHAVDSMTLGLWRIDEGTGTTVADIGPANLDATILRASASGPPRWVSVAARR
jgi:hypothetical protein